jgi:hypothetical protein
MTKEQRLAAQKAKYAAMSKKELETELCTTLVGTLMPLIEMVVERRVSQWIECIRESLEPRTIAGEQEEMCAIGKSR